MFMHSLTSAMFFPVTFIFKLKMDKEEDLQRLDVTTQNALGYGDRPIL